MALNGDAEAVPNDNDTAGPSVRLVDELFFLARTAFGGGFAKPELEIVWT